MGFVFKWHKRMRDIAREDWDNLVGRRSPFLEWVWLNSLEEAGCVSEETGWLPRHLAVYRRGRLVAAAPLYIKGHSWGEFVFDHQWAQLAHQLGRRYYPKLVGMSPFTPTIGYRFLVAESEDEKALCARMLTRIDEFCRENGISGCHFLHTDPQWGELMTGIGMSGWLHHSLVWENQAFGDFDDYLAIFKSQQRKNIKRERRDIDRQQLHFQHVAGAEASPALFTDMYDFYEDTCIKFNRWSHYLNEEFFRRLGADFKQRVLFILAHAAGDDAPVAMSFFIVKENTLYGRYWGCRGNFNHLHFETCYYQPIAWAIANRIKYFDAGSGRALHKKRRGFPARANHSLHRHYDPLMREIWAENIAKINRGEALEIEAINRHCSKNGS